MIGLNILLNAALAVVFGALTWHYRRCSLGVFCALAAAINGLAVVLYVAYSVKDWAT